MGEIDRALSDSCERWLKIIQRDFLDHNPVTACVSFEGQGISPDGSYVLGCRAGPSLHVAHLLHEMSHLAEREIDKLLERPHSSWGFTFGRYWEIMGQSGYEAWTDQSVQREMRVWAYQWSIGQHYGIALHNENTIQELVKPSRWMDAFFHYKDRKVDKSFENFKGDLEAIRVMSEEVLHLSKTQFTFKAFCDAWNERMAALKGKI